MAPDMIAGYQKEKIAAESTAHFCRRQGSAQVTPQGIHQRRGESNVRGMQEQPRGPRLMPLRQV
ncbi:hypothetical protein J4733_11395 [Klebsiella pneumoniae]|uniref:Uncharacterized protein n=1 Tax=Klebsiella pneumoniae TaxID=573 RepID=A0A939NRG5_KLEPN|nr:hypothetical protein [Klebsiella pneumoniae]